MQRIEAGSQIRIAGDLTTADVEAIVAHHAKYGMRTADEANRAKAFVGLCYSIDAPVKLDRMEIVLDLNRSVLIQRGVEARRQAAVATAEAVEKELPPGTLGALEMSVVEEKRDGREVTDPNVAEGVRVDRTHVGPPREEAPALRRRRASRRGEG